LRENGERDERNIIMMIRSKRMRWTGHVARWQRERNAYKILVGKPEEKRQFGRPRCRWEGNIKMDLEEIGSEGVDWTDVAPRSVSCSCEHGSL
jgi:hypothetical protein